MKTVLIPFLFLGCAVYGQQADRVPVRKAMHRLAVKWSPLHLAGYYPTVQLAVEHRVTDRISLQWDAGYVLDTDPPDPKDGFDKKGFKAKLDARYYLPFGGNALFFAPEIYYNYVDFKKSGTFGVDCEGGDCAYFRFHTYTVRYREPGLNLKAGLFHKFGKHICIEYHIGVSHRFIRYQERGKPAESSYEERYEDDVFDFRPDHRSANTLYPSTGFRVGYIFR